MASARGVREYVGVAFPGAGEPALGRGCLADGLDRAGRCPVQELCQVTRGRAGPAAADGGVVVEQHADSRLGDAESSDVLPVFAVFDWLVAHVLAAG
jgi:hypothetical protein